MSLPGLPTGNQTFRYCFHRASHDPGRDEPCPYNLCDEIEVSRLLSSSAQKVQDVLERFGVECQVVELPATTRTAKDAAAAIGCTVEQIVKSLVFAGVQTNRPVLVVASGPNRVNENRIGELFSEPIKKADADFVRDVTGYAIGGVPPVGHETGIETFIDEDLLLYAEIWAAAGTPNAVFKLTPSELCKITGGSIVSIK